MGADFIGAYCKAPKDELTAIKVLADLVISLPEESINYFADEVLGCWEDDNKYAVVLNGAVRAFTYLSSYPRDADVWFLEGNQYWVSGGMSWGDTPTEAFNHIVFLAELDPDW